MTPEPLQACPYALEGAIYQSCPRVGHGMEGEPCEGCPEATARVTGRPATRAAFDRLLAAHPDAEVAWVDNQRKDIMAARREERMRERIGLGNFGFFGYDGPWTCVDLFESGKPLLRFAIWNHTGDVYALDEHGAVEEEPYLRAPAQRTS